MNIKTITCALLFIVEALLLSACAKSNKTTATETNDDSKAVITTKKSDTTTEEETTTELVVFEFTVTYMDELGNTLNTETVKKGEIASFSGITFATNNGGAYLTQFKSWDKSKDTPIIEDTTFTASYYMMPYNTKVANGEIKYYGSMSEITLPEKWDGYAITTLSDFNFSMNSKTAKKTIKIIHLPDSVTKIDGSCFTNCSKLSTIDGGKIETIGGSAFWGCSYLSTIDLSNLKSLGEYAFYGCEFLTVKELPGIDIPAHAFENCTRITEMTIGEGTKTIGDSAFYSSGLTIIKLPDSLETIEDYAFEGCKLTAAYLGKNIKSIGSGNFDSVTKIYYAGTPEEFSSITLSDANRMFTLDRTWFYSEEEPTDTTYHYYHYDTDGNVVDWE